MRSLSFFVAILFAAVGTNAMSMGKTHKNQQKFLRVDTGVKGVETTTKTLSGKFTIKFTAFGQQASVTGQVAGQVKVQKDGDKHHVTLKGLISIQVGVKSNYLIFESSSSAKIEGSMQVTIPVKEEVTNYCTTEIFAYVVGYIIEDFAKNNEQSKMAGVVKSAYQKHLTGLAVKEEVDALLLARQCDGYEFKSTLCGTLEASVDDKVTVFTPSGSWQMCKNWVTTLKHKSGQCVAAPTTTDKIHVFTFAPSKFITLEVTIAGERKEIKLSVRFTQETTSGEHKKEQEVDPDAEKEGGEKTKGGDKEETTGGDKEETKGGDKKKTDPGFDKAKKTLNLIKAILEKAELPPKLHPLSGGEHPFRIGLQDLNPFEGTKDKKKGGPAAAILHAVRDAMEEKKQDLKETALDAFYDALVAASPLSATTTTKETVGFDITFVTDKDPNPFSRSFKDKQYNKEFIVTLVEGTDTTKTCDLNVGFMSDATFEGVLSEEKTQEYNLLSSEN